MKTLKHGGPLALAAVTLLAGFAWLAGWFYDRTAPGQVSGREAEAGAREVAEVVAHEEVVFLPSPGQLRADERSLVTAEMTGKIVDVPVRAGDEVEAGRLIIQIEDKERRARMKQVEQQLKADEATLTEVEAEWRRDKQLYDQNAVPEEKLDTTQRRLKTAQANVQRSQERMTEAEALFADTRILAQSAARVIDAYAEVGEVARPGQPLVELYQPDTLRLECSVPESVVDQLQIGQSLIARMSALGKDISVQVDEIVPRTDSASRTVIVKCRLPQPESFVEGQFGELFVPVRKMRQVSVPRTAVRWIGQLQFVLVVNDQDRTERRYVIVGRDLPSDRVVILSGLKEGERVVVAEESVEASEEQARPRG